MTVRRGMRYSLLAATLIGGACSPGQDVEARIPGYATVHDTMPEAIHQAKHMAVERAALDVSRSHSLVASASRLQRIPGTRDAWLDLSLVRRADGAFATRADTIALLMNCNADSLVVHDAQGRGLTQRLVLAPGDSVHFGDTLSARHIRIYGLRPVKIGQRSETLVRMSLGGDLVVRTPVDP